MGELILRRREMVLPSETGPLYPFWNGETSGSSRTLTVTDGNHFVYTDARTDSYASYINLSKYSQNSWPARIVGNVNNKSRLFTIPAGATVVFEVKNISVTRKGSSTDNISIALRSTGTTAVLASGDFNHSSTGDKRVEQVFEEDKNVSIVSLYANRYLASISADVFLYIDGVRYI